MGRRGVTEYPKRNSGSEKSKPPLWICYDGVEMYLPVSGFFSFLPLGRLIKYKNSISVLLFVITFIATYTILCFALPGAKMALGTTTLDRIWVAITCMALFKVVVSLAVASIVGVLPMIVGKRE